MTTNMKIFEDMEFAVEYFPFSHYVEYKIYKFVDYDADTSLPKLFREDSPWGVDVEHADVFAHDTVKWDGCSNWYFDKQDNCMLHACEREHLVNLGEILAQCWDMTKDLCPNWLEY